MHSRLLVTTRRAQTSSEARWRVYSGLRDGGFLVDPKVRWSGGVADWFVIGGRFTGELAEIGPHEYLARDHGAKLGYEDDALLLTSDLYEEYLEQYEEWSNVDREYVDLEGEELDRSFISRKWLVVVDYHY